ncbi:hypothetical protein J5N58_22920 [Rhizobium cremeum]|uniref:hypothetical protein n=1 Tax=Rhizobium cremeum TaxID=2813827 RepID=UPI000DE174CE|nr:hypothetical protein [Rhizobium cremeum]MCJ7997446.1 hypothetical protein [Rhizobium cremeum]MCJ8002540.1 hypothetical protein [Rhizobium cremeum]
MRRSAVVLLLACVAGCSQTQSAGGDPAAIEPATLNRPAAKQAKPKPSEMPSASRQMAQTANPPTGREADCEAALKREMNSAMAGNMLGMAGGFVGFGGRGGAIASQVASTAGGMIAQQQQAKARQALERDCYGSSVAADPEMW